MLVALQTLDGIGAGVYGVVIVAICADLTKGKGGFNALAGWNIDSRNVLYKIINK